MNTARSKQFKHTIGTCFSEDLFYNPQSKELHEKLIANNVKCIEMEAAGLYGLSAEMGKNALAILTISDITSKQP